MTDTIAQKRPRRVLLIRNVWIRTTVALCMLVAAMMLAAALFREGQLEVLVPGSALAWAVATYLTHKYVHKYSQRFVTYLLASHCKAAVIQAALFGILGWAGGPSAAPWNVIWLGFGLFGVADLLLSALSRRELAPPSAWQAEAPSRSTPPASVPTTESVVDRDGALAALRVAAPGTFGDIVETLLPSEAGPNASVSVLDRAGDGDAPGYSAGLTVASRRLNDVYRLDGYLRACASATEMGGYIAAHYEPLEDVGKRLRARYGRALSLPASALHFVWRQALPKTPGLGALQHTVTGKGHHALARAEVWGRLAYAGFYVTTELSRSGEQWVMARRIAPPVEGQRPSYHPVIALEKVGLDGKVIHLHKLRSMAPYSEFLQKRIYEEHGLTSTGKFANDFRITRFGRFVRKYWLDELPQVFDWLRGDIKLVGMRATSPQYLSLYPQEVRDLYVAVKPGLVPPVFDESTNGFDRIVEVEHAYLRRYLAAPIRTDVAYFVRTWTDIFRRGVRGK